MPAPETLTAEGAAAYTVEVWRAGEDCRSKLAGIRAWSEAVSRGPRP